MKSFRCCFGFLLMFAPLHSRAANHAVGDLLPYLGRETTELGPESISLPLLCALTAIDATSGSRVALDIQNIGWPDDHFRIAETLPHSTGRQVWSRRTPPGFFVEGTLDPNGTLTMNARTAFLRAGGTIRTRATRFRTRQSVQWLLGFLGNRVHAIRTHWTDVQNSRDNFDQYMESLADQGVRNPFLARSEQHLRAAASTFSGNFYARLGYSRIDITMMAAGGLTRGRPTDIYAQFTRPGSFVAPQALQTPPFRIRIDDNGWEVDIGNDASFQLIRREDGHFRFSVGPWPDDAALDPLLTQARAWALARYPEAPIVIELDDAHLTASQQVRVADILSPHDSRSLCHSPQLVEQLSKAPQ